MATKTSAKSNLARRLDKIGEGDRISGWANPRGGYDTDIASARDCIRNRNTEGLSDRFHWMLPENRRKYQRDIASAIEDRFDRTNPDEMQQLSDLIKQSERNKEIAGELADYRTFEVTSDILATPFALAPFQAINLSANELPQIITPAARQYFTVRYMGRDGQSRQDQWRSVRSAQEFEMDMIATDKIEWTLFDIQQGDVNEFAKINEQLRFDLEMKIDGFALDNVLAAKTVSGLRSLMNIHPNVDQNAIPDTNYLDLTDVPTYGAAGTWTLPRIKALLNHIAMWGFGLDPAGAISIASMIMSPLNARDSWDYVDLVSGYDSTATFGQNRPDRTVPTAVREQIFNSGSMIQSAWGYTWQTQYNPQVAKGRAYVFTNLPLGWYFTKSEYDRTIIFDGPEQQEMNYNQIVMQKVLRFLVPDLWKYRIVIIDF